MVCFALAVACRFHPCSRFGVSDDFTGPGANSISFSMMARAGAYGNAIESFTEDNADTPALERQPSQWQAQFRDKAATGKVN